MSEQSDAFPPGSFTTTLVGLYEKGVRYSTVIDIGCADGHFFLTHAYLGVFQGAVALNLDANPIYEKSLRAIKDVMGGEYLIAAVTDECGEVELATSDHPYWGSIVPEDNTYWQTVTRKGLTKTPAVTLDAAVKQFNLAPPYLIKLDVQGNELKALRGGRNVLSDTCAVICELAPETFNDIHATLTEAGFGLFDLTGLNWLTDRSLGWFYPVYLNHKFDHLKPKTAWDSAQLPFIVQTQINRRSMVLDEIAQLLAKLKDLRQQSDPIV